MDYEDIEQILFLEKYRPETLDEVIGHEHKIARLKRLIKNRNLPHLLFTGAQGIGKTTMAIALANELFGDEFVDKNFKEMNASDSRGIDTVRGPIQDFASTVPYGPSSFKVLFLDEADELTKDAQAALRRTMEIHSDSCRFILGCNWSNKLIEPIQSRCAIFRFTVLSKANILKIIDTIDKGEDMRLPNKVKDYIADAAKGDARIAVNALQELSYIEGKVTIDEARYLIGWVDQELVERCLKEAFEGKFQRACATIDEMIYQYGYSGSEILEMMANIIDSMEMSRQDYGRLMAKIGDIDNRMTNGRSERIQLRCLIGWFGVMKYISPECPKAELENFI